MKSEALKRLQEKINSEYFEINIDESRYECDYDYTSDELEKEREYLSHSQELAY